MRLITAVVFALLPIGAAFAGEDSTHRFHGSGPEWHEVTSALHYQDADCDPSNVDDRT